MTRRRILLVFDQHYTSNGQQVYAATRELIRQSVGDFDYRVICRGRYRGPRFEPAERVKVTGRPVEPITQERRLLERVRRKIARFRLAEANDRWISNVDSADRPVLASLFEADDLHAVIVFTVDPAYGLKIVRLAHLYATSEAPHLVVVTTAAVIPPKVAGDLHWLKAKILRDGHSVLGRAVMPHSEPEPVLTSPPRSTPAEVPDLLAVVSVFSASLPLAFLDPDAYPSYGLQMYRLVVWRDWLAIEQKYPARVRNIVLFIRPDWMACGSGTTFENLARWFRANETLLIDIGVWPYSVPFQPSEAVQKLVEQEAQLGAALYFSVRSTSSIPHLLRQLGYLSRWLPTSIIRQVLLQNTRAAKPGLLRKAVQRAKVTQIYMNHYFTYLFAEDLIAGRKFFLDTHDVQAVNFVHNGTRNLLTRRAESFDRLLADEMEVASLAERLCFVNLDEMELAGRFIRRDKLDYIIALPNIRPCRQRPANKIPQLLLVASNNAANQRNLIWLFDQVLPILGDLLQEHPPNTARLPLPEINLCGSIAAILPPKLSPLLKVHGIVPDLRDYYDASDIVLLPVITGGGVAIKTIEALLHERPVVATRHALRGLPSEIADIVGYENDPEAFARQIVELLRSQRAREHQAGRVRKAAQRLREERFYERLANAMEAVRL